MNWTDFIRGGHVRKGSKEIPLAKSLLAQTKQDIAYFDTLKVVENSARKIVSNYYDFLRSILEAMSALDGYKIYSHEAFTSYLQEKDEKTHAEKLDRMIDYFIGKYLKEVDDAP